MRRRGGASRRKPETGGDPAGSPTITTASDPAGSSGAAATPEQVVALERRRDVLKARVAELQWDLGGLVYEMAIRDRIRVEILVKRAALLQDADSELGEIERILRLEQTATAGACASCGAPHSTGASYCWQCGQPILQQVSSDSIFS
jgi:hypothetical protein